MSTVQAPWSDEQVAALNKWQNCDFVHPYTCPNRGDHLHPEDKTGERGRLVARADGWYCLHCDYRQDWALDMMFDPVGLEDYANWIDGLKKRGANDGA